MTPRRARCRRPTQLQSRAGSIPRWTRTPFQASEVRDNAAAAQDPSTPANTPEKYARWESPRAGLLASAANVRDRFQKVLRRDAPRRVRDRSALARYFAPPRKPANT